jgi:hypothetical protein
MRVNRIWNRTSDEMRADEMDEIRRKIKSLTSDNQEKHFRRNTTIPIRRSTALNDELASVLPTIIDSSRERSYIVQKGVENQNNNSRRNSNFSMTDSRRNSNFLQDFMKEIRRSVEYEDDDIDVFENDDNDENNIIDVESSEENRNDNTDIEEENTAKKSGCGRKALFIKQIKKMLCKSCSIGLKASVLLLGHILLSIFKVLAFI